MKRVVAAVIEKQGKLLVCQRTRHQTMPLKWEFPGGKIEEGEQPRDALRRELEEELGIHAKVGDEIARVQHDYPNGAAVELQIFHRAGIRWRNRKPHLSRFAVGRSRRIAVVRFSRSGCLAGKRSGNWKAALGSLFCALTASFSGDRSPRQRQGQSHDQDCCRPRDRIEQMRIDILAHQFFLVDQ